MSYLIKSRIIFMFIAALMFCACSVKDDRLFQTTKIIDRDAAIITDEEYKEELGFEYKIAPNDRVNIMIYVQSGSGSQQMNSILATRGTIGIEANVQQDIGLLVTQEGTVRLPLVGSVKVVGYTEDQAADMLIAEYKKYIRSPYVTVEITNQRVIVVGEVQTPGVIPIINGTMNLIEVISRAGYLTPLAERTNVKIIRGNLRDPEIRVIDLTDGASLLESSLLLKPNDIVYVSARQMDGYNKAFSEAKPFFETLSAIINPFAQIAVIKGIGGL